MNQPKRDSDARLNILPARAYLDLRPALVNRLDRVVSNLRASQFGLLLEPILRLTLERGLLEAGAHEGTVWLVDEAQENLVLVYNTGPHAAELVGKFRQPLNAGMICMVFATEQPFVENDVQKNSRQSKLLDSLLNVQTCAMVAVPFYLLRACRGVVSCVQLKRPDSTGPDPPGFRPEHLASIQWAVALLSQLIEFRLLSRAVGWTCE